MNRTRETRFGDTLSMLYAGVGHKTIVGPVCIGDEALVDLPRCNNLKGIYGADMYAPTAVQVLRTENATLRRRVKAYAAVALLGWVAVVIMGVML